MANDQDRTSAGGTQSDISKSQSQQQPNQGQQQGENSERSGQFETGEQGREDRSGDQAATGQSQGGSPDEGMQGDTQTQQRTDVEGTSQQSPESGQADRGFVGSEGQKDSSSKLVEDEEFRKDGQGAPEGK